MRSLGRRGLRVAALETFDKVPAFSSRWYKQKVVCQAEEGTTAYLKYLEQVLDDTSVRVLIASSDATVALICLHREQLEKRVCIALAKEPAFQYLPVHAQYASYDHDGDEEGEDIRGGKKFRHDVQ
jgi:predicted ATP-grasp superfamily ATP-dependent carboligase